jgi:polyisoprenoid-binding protein YceI
MANRTHVTTIFAMAVTALVSANTSTFAQSADSRTPTPVEVRGGTASFDVDTNIPALSVHGKSTALEARVRVRQGANGPELDQIEAIVPVKTLVTGMGLRDEHMRRYIFTTQDGQTPDVKFVAGKTTCAKSGGNQSTCQLAGDLVIRGTSRPFVMALKVTEDSGSFHASGDAIVKLSTYGIAQPSQLGVRTSDEVKLKLDFTARPGPVATTGATR